MWVLFNIEHSNVKLMDKNIQGEKPIDTQVKNMGGNESWWVEQVKVQSEMLTIEHLKPHGMTTIA